MKQQGKALDEYEEDARHVIERHLGVPVIQHDTNLSPRMPDLLIMYPGRPHGVVEVGRDVDQRRLKQSIAIRDKANPLNLPGLSLEWSVIIRPDARVSGIEKALSPVLYLAEAAGRDSFGRRDWSADPLDKALKRAGFDKAWARRTPPVRPGRVAVYEQPEGWWGPSPERVVDWAEAMLARATDNARKLRDSGYTERHLFLFADFYGAKDVASALMIPTSHPDATPLPLRRPCLVEGVDCLWIRGVKRVIGWFPETGWTDVA